jgi:hypothetical protein
VIRVVFILNYFSSKLFDILVDVVLEANHLVVPAVLQLIDNCKGKPGHKLDAGWVVAASSQLFVDHEQVEDVRKIVKEVGFFHVVSHDKVEKIGGNGLPELLLTHDIVHPLWQVGVLSRLTHVVQMPHTRLQRGPDFDRHCQEFVQLFIELNLRLHC